MKYVGLKKEDLPIGSCFIARLELKSHLRHGWIDLAMRRWKILVNKCDMSKGSITGTLGD